MIWKLVRDIARSCAARATKSRRPRFSVVEHARMGADVQAPSFTYVRHLSDSQIKHYRKTGEGHRPVVCRACNAARAEGPKFECSACPRKGDGKKPAFSDGSLSSKDQKKNFFQRNTPVVCAKCFKAGREPRRDTPKAAQVFRCGACPKGADGQAPVFTDVRHLSDRQMKHYRQGPLKMNAFFFYAGQLKDSENKPKGRSK